MKYKIHKDNLEELELKGVYIIKNYKNGLIKIGKTINLKRRFKEIKGSFKFCGDIPELKIEYFIECDLCDELEKYLHDKLKEYNSLNEWFNIRDVNIVMELINNANIKKEYKTKPNKIKTITGTTTNMEFNNDFKLTEYYVPKSYLKDKNFPYKLYLQLCTNMFLTQFKDNEIVRYEYKLNYINIEELCKNVGLSRNTLLKKINGKPYRLKTDELGNKHLMIYTPKNNFIKINKDIVNTLILFNEMDIRLFIYIYSYSFTIIYGLTNSKILEDIGYNNKSKSNESKLIASINTLIKNNLIKREIKSNGKKKYSVFHKMI